MRALFLVFIFVYLALLFQGCQVRGISGSGRTTTLGYDLTRLESRDRVAEPLRLPLHLVVAQAGATHPDSRLMHVLSSQKKLFSRVSALPAAPELRNFASEVEQRNPQSLIKLADRTGGDVLFLVGGQTATQSSKTPVSILDLTIIGHYLIPSNKIKTKGSVCAAIIRISDSKLVLTLQQSAEETKIAPSVSRHANADELTDKIVGQLLSEISKKFVNKLANNAGVVPNEIQNPVAELNSKSKIEKVATVYVISDGFHIGLVLPYREIGSQKKYIEIGLGERNWAMDQNWRWLTSILSGMVPQNGIAVIEKMNELEMSEKKRRQKKVWQLTLTEREWGEMLSTLESEVSLQNVLVDGRGIKVVKTVKGYHLFHTCQQFALNPLGKIDNGLSGKFTLPPPMLEHHLDEIFSKTAWKK